jgi:hypothetical protein
MLYKFNEYNINERYNSIKGLPFDEMINKKYEYIDYVYDHIVNIIMDEQEVSEKDFSNIDKITSDVKLKFNDDIKIEINKFEQLDKRAEYCAEIVYDKYFNGHYITEKKVAKYGKDALLNSRSIPSDMKDKILPFVSSGSKYSNKRIYGLIKPKIKGKSFDGVSLGADKNGFFVYTHRARSKSYDGINKIPDKDIKFIESTG